MRALIVCILMTLSLGCVTTVTPGPVQTNVRPILIGQSCVLYVFGFAIGTATASFDEAVKNGLPLEVPWRKRARLPTQQIHSVRSVSIIGAPSPIVSKTCVEVVGE